MALTTNFPQSKRRANPTGKFLYVHHVGRVLLCAPRGVHNGNALSCAFRLTSSLIDDGHGGNLGGNSIYTRKWIRLSLEGYLKRQGIIRVRRATQTTKSFIVCSGIHVRSSTLTDPARTERLLSMFSRNSVAKWRHTRPLPF